MKIGVFDSGKGGHAMAARLAELLPDAEIMCVDDHEHVPYGNRTNEDITALTTAAIQPLIDEGCDAIVIACNTATTVALPALRAAYPQIPFVGIEPMVKPAAQLTKNGRLAVLATPATLASKRYEELKQTWASEIMVIEPDCRDWAELIESNQLERIAVKETINRLMEDNVDVIVLGCTHYHLIKQIVLRHVKPDVQVLEPSDAIAERIKSLL